MKITKQMLRQAGACREQLDEFIRRHPDGFDATEASCSAAAAEYGWDTGWAAMHLLPAPLLADYRAKHAPLWADFDAKCAALWADYRAVALRADYDAKHAALRADFDAKCAALWADYRAKHASLLADYDAKFAALRADYDAKRAALFGRLAEQVE